MAFDSKTRKKLIAILRHTPYRKEVSQRTNVHPNTVSNTLLQEGYDNPKVELEILIYAQEVQLDKQDDVQFRKKAAAIAKQL